MKQIRRHCSMHHFIWGLMLMLFSTAGHTQTVTIDFNSLPSSQGWTYVGSPLVESAAFSVNGSSLFQSTFGSGSSSFAFYEMEGLVDSSKRMTLAFTARVLNYENLSGGGGSFGLGFNFRIRDNVIDHHLGLRDNLIQVNGQFFNIDTTVFHDYIFNLNPDGSSELFVDGSLLATGTGGSFTGNNLFFFGDTTGHENTDAEITALSFTIVPVPAEVWLFGSCLMGLIGIAKHKKAA